MKLRIRRTIKFKRSEIEKDTADVFLNWETALFVNKRTTRTSTSRFKSLTLQRYRFGLSHNELKADLSSMLEKYRHEMGKNNKPPSLQRVTRTMKKRRIRISRSPQNHNTDQLINTTIDMNQCSHIKKRVH